MKSILRVIPILIVAIAISCGNKTKTGDAATGTGADAKSDQKAPAGDKKLPFERGSYVEEANMMGIEMKKTVYFDKWGDWTATENKSEMTIMGTTHKTEKLEIAKGKTHWNLDLVEKKGTTYESFVPTAGMAAALGAAVGGKMAEGTEIKDLGTENYLGYTCKKTQVKYSKMDMDVTVLAYGNLTMKMEGSMGKTKISTAVTSINLSAPPASIFEVPADIKVEKQELGIKN